MSQKGEKNKAKKKKKEDPQQSRCADEGPGPVATVVSAPGEKETSTPLPEQSQKSPLARFTDSHGVTKEEEDPNSQEWLLSLTDHLDAMGPSKFRLPEGWMDFKEEEFSSVVTDALAAAGVNTMDLPEGWMTVIWKKRKKKVPTLPNLPPHLFVDKMASP